MPHVVQYVIRALLDRLRTRRKDTTNDDEEYPDVHLNTEEIHRLLSSERRRLVIGFVANDLADGETVSLDTLAEYVATCENDTQPGELGHRERKSAYVNLYQSHIPKLEAAGIIEWDERACEVAASQSTQGLAEIIRYSQRASSPVTTTPDVLVGAPQSDIGAIEVKASV